MDGMKCFAHYRVAVATCASCGTGMCGECAARHRDGLCTDCHERDRGAAEQMQLQREARLALRRAGVAVPRLQGDPVFVRANGHPLVAGMSLAVCILAALGLGACSALAEQRWGIPRPAIAPLLGIVLGSVVTAVLGGTSRLAGAAAVLLAALAVVGGTGALSMLTAVSLPGGGEAVGWLEAHRAVALLLDGVALPLAYLTAAGRRI